MGDFHGVNRPAQRALTLQPQNARAATIAVLVSALFLVVYGSTNWYTAQRPASEVRTWYFAWELTAVPYVPLLIVPYMSIDLLFFLAPFLCRDRRELSVLARRLTFSILVAAAFLSALTIKASLAGAAKRRRLVWGIHRAVL